MSEQARKVLNGLPEGSECLFDSATVDQAFQRMAVNIDQDYPGQEPVLLAVMIGGLLPLAMLVRHLQIRVQIDYLHATRYHSGTEGKDLVWKAEPHLSLQDRDVIVVDDILDEGVTLQSIVSDCKQRGARSVKTAVMTVKNRPRPSSIPAADYVGLEVPNRYVFGMGMDYLERYRDLMAIYALPERD